MVCTEVAYSRKPPPGTAFSSKTRQQVREYLRVTGSRTPGGAGTHTRDEHTQSLQGTQTANLAKPTTNRDPTQSDTGISQPIRPTPTHGEDQVTTRCQSGTPGENRTGCTNSNKYCTRRADRADRESARESRRRRRRRYLRCGCRVCYRIWLVSNLSQALISS